MPPAASPLDGGSVRLGVSLNGQQYTAQHVRFAVAPCRSLAACANYMPSVLWTSYYASRAGASSHVTDNLIGSDAGSGSGESASGYGSGEAPGSGEAGSGLSGLTEPSSGSGEQGST